MVDLAKTRKGHGPSEAQVQKSVIDYLRWQNITFFRINVVGIPLKDGSFRPNSQMKGIADLSLIIDGKSVWFEIKRLNGRQTQHQKDFAEKVRKAGGYYFLIRSVEQAQSAINYLRGMK